MTTLQGFDPNNMTLEQTREWSSQQVALLQENTEESRKTAAMNMQDYLRPTNREASWCSKVLTPTEWDESERVQDRTHDQPQMLIEVEPDSAGAEHVDFGNIPETFTPYGKRIPMTMTAVETQRIVKNAIELGAYKYNFRTVLTDLLSLKLAFMRDSRFMAATNACIAPVGTPLTYTGKDNQSNAGAPWDYHTHQRALNVMRGQPNAIEPATAVASHLMIGLIKSQLVKDAPGTQVVTDIFDKGFTELTLQGDNMKFIFTNKQTLVPAHKFYYYGPENQLGRYVQMIEPTMLVENRGLKISFGLYEVLGILIANQAAVSATNYTPS
jgi:hypothetical protein